MLKVELIDTQVSRSSQSRETSEESNGVTTTNLQIAHGFFFTLYESVKINFGQQQDACDKFKCRYPTAYAIKHMQIGSKQWNRSGVNNVQCTCYTKSKIPIRTQKEPDNLISNSSAESVLQQIDKQNNSY